MSDLIKEMCVAQKCCRMCPIGKELRTIPLDCKQYIAFFPAKAEELAEKWKEEQA